VKRALLAGLVASCLFPAAAEAAPRLALFPTPLTPITSTPPFPPPDTALPNVYKPPIRSNTRVAVGIDKRGQVVSVEATQRLVLKRLGDYRLTVPAPVRDVVAAAGSQSSPGLHKGAVVWSGFSAGRKVLAARATLDPRPAGALLPLQLEISDGSVRLRNATGATATTFTANGDPVQLAKILDALRRDPQGRTLGRGTYVQVTGKTETLKVRVASPLRVTGRIGDRKISLVLGEEARTIHVSGRPLVRLTVEPFPSASLSSAPRQPTWNEAVTVSLTLARVRQYAGYLANPDPLGATATRYVYRTTAAPAPPSVPPAPQDEGLPAWTIALIAPAALAAAGGLAVVWARS
jgi:hypothetical protein